MDMIISQLTQWNLLVIKVWNCVMFRFCCCFFNVQFPLSTENWNIDFGMNNDRTKEPGKRHPILIFVYIFSR